MPKVLQTSTAIPDHSDVPGLPRKSIGARMTGNDINASLIGPLNGLNSSDITTPTIAAVVTTGRKNMVRKPGPSLYAWLLSTMATPSESTSRTGTATATNRNERPKASQNIGSDIASR